MASFVAKDMRNILIVSTDLMAGLRSFCLMAFLAVTIFGFGPGRIFLKKHQWKHKGCNQFGKKTHDWPTEFDTRQSLAPPRLATEVNPKSASIGGLVVEARGMHHGSNAK